jgi:predicted O-methyltransferase YrrM
MIKNSCHVDDKITKYIEECSLRMAPIQRKLMEHTLTSMMKTDDVMKRQLCSSPDQSQLIQFMARAIGAKTCLEIGCLTGCTAVALALAMPHDGLVITVDETDKHINKDVRNMWKEAGVESKVVRDFKKIK